MLKQQNRIIRLNLQACDLDIKTSTKSALLPMFVAVYPESARFAKKVEVAL